MPRVNAYLSTLAFLMVLVLLLMRQSLGGTLTEMALTQERPVSLSLSESSAAAVFIAGETLEGSLMSLYEINVDASKRFFDDVGWSLQLNANALTWLRGSFMANMNDAQEKLTPEPRTPFSLIPELPAVHVRVLAPQGPPAAVAEATSVSGGAEGSAASFWDAPVDSGATYTGQLLNTYAQLSDTLTQVFVGAWIGNRASRN